ncbi:hypothetical protein Droror1_Dr00019781 [Drosera rotundifolia]
MCVVTPWERTAADTAQSHSFAGPVAKMARFEDLSVNITLGQFYEIDRSKLPPGTPTVLPLSVRVVMVTGKTELSITVRYPSTKSLETFFYGTEATQMPNMDQKSMMEPDLAAQVLVRKISSRDFQFNRNCKSFWMVQSVKNETYTSSDSVCTSVEDTMTKGRTCLLKLQNSGLEAGDGHRIPSDMLNGDPESCISSPNETVGNIMEEEGKVTRTKGPRSKRKCRSRILHPLSFISSPIGTAGKIKEEEGNVTVTNGARSKRKYRSLIFRPQSFISSPNESAFKIKEEDGNDTGTKRARPKQKCLSLILHPQSCSSSPNESACKIKEEELKEKRTKSKRCERTRDSLILDKTVGKSISDCNQLTSKLKTKNKQRMVDNSRWTADRYQRATMELLAALKRKKAFCSHPVSRYELREEARKQIGDTGLLDHLLKHLAGEVAPDGIHRFRRRFDPEGSMEYWLESADLVDIRKQAGITDFFWIPPPGWRLGDPIYDHGSECAKEIKMLREELDRMKWKKQELQSVNEGDLMALDTSPDCLDGIDFLEIPDIDQLEQIELKEKYEKMLKFEAQAKKQLLSITETLRDMEVLMTQQQ